MMGDRMLSPPQGLAISRETINSLSQLQEELRTAVRSDLLQSRLPMGTYARRLDIQWTGLHRFLNEGRALCGGKALHVLATKVGRPDLETSIERLSIGVNDRLRGLAAFSQPAIGCVFDLKDGYERVRDKLTVAKFAERFGSHSDTVRRSILDDRKAIARLERLDVREAIEQVLRPPERVLPETAPEAATPAQLVTSTKGTAPRPATPTLAQVLERHGGVTSKRGLPFVLTGASFEQIEGDPGETFVALTRRQVRLVRALLNVAAQLADEQIRRAIREQLSDEVAELYGTIEMFTFSHPSRLTQVFDAQRKTLESRSMAPKPHRKGRKP